MFEEIKTILKDAVDYIKKLCDSTDPTSMTRFICFVVIAPIMLLWAIFSVTAWKLVIIPDSVLELALVAVGGKALKDIWCSKNKQSE